MNTKNILNYWLNINKQLYHCELLGFSNIEKDTNVGQCVGTEYICPLLLFHNANGWGDSTPSSVKYSWILYAPGVDDIGLYMLFGTKEGALKFASDYLNGSSIINPKSDHYKDRKWQWQN
jgi:hypothetical protein